MIIGLCEKYGIRWELDEGGESPTREIHVPADELLKGLEIKISYKVPIQGSHEIELQAKSPSVGNVSVCVQRPALLKSMLIALATAHEGEQTRDTTWLALACE